MLPLDKDEKNALFTTQKMIERFSQLKPKLNFEPGKKFAYCNTNYVLLAEIIERTTHQTFEAFLKENIFQPLKMHDSQVFNLLSKNEPDNRVYGYKQKHWLLSGTTSSRDLNHFDGVAGDGAVYSSCSDLFKWHLALREGRLISKEDYQIAYQPAQLNDGNLARYGFGWFLNNAHSVEHAGGWQGFSSFLYTETLKVTI